MSDCEEEMPMRDFIEQYKNMPELWNCKSDKYKNKNIRKRSYDKLLVEYKKIKNDATVDDVKRKIANMRTCYRRELKRYMQSERSGAGADDIYVPSLWYFDLFSFLRDLEVPVFGRSNLSSEEDEEAASTPIKTHQQNKSKKKCALDLRTEFLKKAAQHLESSTKKEVHDDAAIYASGWACMIRQMTANQQLYAKQAIDEIVMLGRLNKLSLNFLQRANSSPICTSQDMSEASTSYSGSVSSPHFVAVPFTSPALSSDSAEFNTQTEYNSVYELLSDTQFQ